MLTSVDRPNVLLRKTVFWIHLACGVTAGLVVAMMSVTGALLTYERQMVAWADREHYVGDSESSTQRRPLAEQLAAAQRHNPSFVPTTITVRNDPRAPVAFAAGRNGTLLVNPYTLAVSEQGGETLRSFFETIEGWHRWFNATGDNRATGRAITGASNLAFLFLVLSGMYLWLPRVFKWAAFKTRLTFNAKAESGKARDFNWHHVFGIWTAVPLAVVVASAVVFSYPWANDLVYRSVGEEPPVRGAQRGGSGGPAAAPNSGSAGPRTAATASGMGGRAELAATQSSLAGSNWGSSSERATYDELLARAAAEVRDWRALALNIPAEPDAPTVRIGVDQGNGGQPQRRHTIVLDASTGAVQAWQPFSSQSTGQKARSWIRFLHTGEALGIVGQTIAGIVSLTSVLMVWTGLALAYRRLIVPLYSRRG
jgi:uncharacterized iron-regulated membrane protein